MITHQNIISNVSQSLYMKNLRGDYPESLETDTPEERWLGFLPLYHAFGQLWSISAAAKSRTPVYMMRKFSYDAWLQHVQTHRITNTQLTPLVYVMLAKRPETQQYDLSSLRTILCGGAPLSAELQNEVIAIGDNLLVGQTMGMTEPTCSTAHTPGLMEDLSGSMGLADPNCIFKLVDESDREVGENQRGELLVEGPNVCAGYWRNEKATKNLFDSDGFLRSGDVAIRRDNWHWIIDRKNELTKVNGFQIAPVELEAALLENEDVADAATVGLRVGLEEKPRAYVVLKAMPKVVLEKMKSSHGWLGK